VGCSVCQLMNPVVDVFVCKMSPSNLSLHLFCMFLLVPWFPELVHIYVYCSVCT
jgi:hypothetical protein